MMGSELITNTKESNEIVEKSSKTTEKAMRKTISFYPSKQPFLIETFPKRRGIIIVLSNNLTPRGVYSPEYNLIL